MNFSKNLLKHKAKKVALTAMALTMAMQPIVAQAYNPNAEIISTNLPLYSDEKSEAYEGVRELFADVRDNNYYAAKFAWNAATSVVPITGHTVGPKSLPKHYHTNRAGEKIVDEWWDSSEPATGYSVTPGSSYRIKNLGEITSTQEKLDVILTVKDSTRANTHFPGKMYLVNSSDYTDKGVAGRAEGLGRNVDSLGIWLKNTTWIDFDYKIVKAGTDEGVNVQFMSYFWDIDYGQSIKENFGSLKTVFKAGSDLLRDADGTVRSPGNYHGDGIQPYPDTFYDKTAYITHTKMAANQTFDIKYALVDEAVSAASKPAEPLKNITGRKHRVHTEGEGNDSAIVGTGEELNAWFLQFGTFEHQPNYVRKISKSVSDLNENSRNQVTIDNTNNDTRKASIEQLREKKHENHLGLINREQTFYIDVPIEKGSTRFRQLQIQDTVDPLGANLVKDSGVITNSSGKDVTYMFNVTYNDNTFLADLKPEYLGSDELVNTLLTARFNVVGKRWLGGTFDNIAYVDTGYHDVNGETPRVETNKTTTTIPQDGNVKKSVSVDLSAKADRNNDNVNYVPADVPDRAPVEDYRGANYVWKNVYTLPNLTQYTDLHLRDIFENIQELNEDDIEVYDWDGNKVTNQGTFSITDANQNNRANYANAELTKQGDARKMIVWTANAGMLSKVNEAFGKTSKNHPSFTMKIKTKVTDGSLELKGDKYVNSAGEVVIPNLSGYSVKDDSGAGYYHQDGNYSHVKLRPGIFGVDKPGKPNEDSPKKYVTDYNEENVDNAHTGLVNRDLTYTLKMKSTYGTDYKDLIITDELPAQFTTSVGNVSVVNASNRNITSLFDISLNGRTLTLTLKDTAKSSQDVKRTTIYVYIKGQADRWVGDMFTNEASFDIGGPNNKHKTNIVKTTVPQDGSIEKKNSTKASVYSAEGEDGGNYGKNFTDYVRADSVATANQVPHYDNNYEWEVSFTLPNLTKYTSLEFEDKFRNVQELDTSKIRVYWANGVDVNQNIADRGTFTVTKDKTNPNISIINWKASQAFLDDMNAAYGKESKNHPEFKMYIPTNIRNSNKETIAPYVNEVSKDITIPNEAKFIVDDDSGKVVDGKYDSIGKYEKESNVSWVKVAAKLPDLPQFPPNTPDPKKPPVDVPSKPPVYDPNGGRYYITPTKLVSDSDEKFVSRNNVGLTKRDMSYTIKFETTPGTHFNTLEIHDEMPKEFTTALDRISIVNSKGEDVTGLFDGTLSDANVYHAKVKTAEVSNPKIKGTVLTVTIDGQAPRWLGGKFKNGAWVRDEYHTYYTNLVETRDPSEPIVKKSVSVDNGKTYTASETAETAALVDSRPDRYRWKMDYTLSNYSLFTEITLADVFQNVQKIDLKDVHVYNAQGVEVTNRGDFADIEKNTQGNVTNIIWTAKRELVEETNRNYGPESELKPMFTMTVDTDVKDASNRIEALYYNSTLDRIVIPNEAYFIEADAEGSVTTKSNPSHVTFPKPGDPQDPHGPRVNKRVSEAGKNDWQATLELKTFETLYDYKTTFKLSNNHNYDDGDLELVDTFENVQSHGDIRILDAEEKDVTDQFTITEGTIATPNTTDETVPITIKAVPKVANDWDDKGTTVHMLIKDVKLKGDSAKRLVDYMEDNPETPFTEGVTIPNESHLREGHGVKNFEKLTKSNKTYVNITVQPRIVKSVEDDNMPVIDPKTAVRDNTSLKDAVGLSQYVLSELVKKNPKLVDSDTYRKLKDSLLSPNVTVTELMNKLNEAYKLKTDSKPIPGTTQK